MKLLLTIIFSLLFVTLSAGTTFAQRLTIPTPVVTVGVASDEAKLASEAAKREQEELEKLKKEDVTSPESPEDKKYYSSTFQAKTC